MEKLKQIALYVLIFLSAAFLITSIIEFYYIKHSEKQLSDKDAVIQKFNAELGLSASVRTDQDRLIEKYKKELSDLSVETKKLIDKNNLKLQSTEHTVAVVKNHVKGGTTTVSGQPPAGQTITYDWKDAYNRFHLSDPDVYTKNNEDFTASQIFSLKGYVFSDKSGKVQIKKIELSEVFEDGKDSSGKPIYKKIPDSNTNIVSSEFEYVAPVGKTKVWTDIFSNSLLATFDSQLSPGIGYEIINLGPVIDYVNIGIAPAVSFDISDLPGSIKNSRVGVDLTYRLAAPLIKTNLGITAGISTPANNFLQNYTLTVGAAFYLTN